MVAAELTQDRLFEVLFYNPRSGLFYWNLRTRTDLNGMVAGKINPNGYRQIKIDQRYYYAHRLAFLYVLGRWPSEQVDHINRLKDDNRWKNLREATPAQNSQNAFKNQVSKSGHRWVYPTASGAFMVMVKDSGKQVYIGTFTTKKDAAAAAICAIRERHGYFAALEKD
jgi:hypothetical protein